MVITLLIVSAFICGTLAVPLVRERRQYGMQYGMPYSSYYGMPMQAQETPCQLRSRMSEPSWTKPVCNLDGSFREYQCEPYSRFKCWCVYSNGMMIPGSAKDFKDDPLKESTKLNCAAKRASAPKPAPKPAPIKTPYQDRSIGWHLAYRDAAMKNNPYGAFYGSYGYPASTGYGASSYYPPQQAAVTYSAPVSSPVSTYSSGPSYASSYAAPLTGCPDPCAPPCSCVAGAYRGVLPHVAKPAPAKPVAVADKEEKNDDESEEDKDSDDEQGDDDDDNDESDKKEDEQSEDDEDDAAKPVEHKQDKPAKTEVKETTVKQDEPSKKNDEKKTKKDDKPVVKTGVKETEVKSPAKKEDKASGKIVVKAKTNVNKKTKDGKKRDKTEKKEKDIDGIDEEDEEDN